MMIAAIYARKSTEQERDVDARLPSIERQVEHASAYAVRKGWTVDEAERRYVRGAIIDAEFGGRRLGGASRG